MRTQCIVAGHGGQGVLELGNYIGYFEMLKGRHVAYTPSYGPETRGGKVRCYVVASEEEIDSPIAEQPDYLVVMNVPSMDYVPLLKIGGVLLMNSSLIPQGPQRKDIRSVSIPATEIAIGLRDPDLKDVQNTSIVSNSVMFGGYLAITGEELDVALVKEVFGHFLTERKALYVRLNLLAAQRGYEFVKSTIMRPIEAGEGQGRI